MGKVLPFTPPSAPRPPRPWAIYAALVLTAFFFLLLIFIPILGHSDTYGVPKTFSNANARVAAEDAH